MADGVKKLLIGLGGTGSTIVNKVADMVGGSSNDISFVCIDTDINDKTKFNNNVYYVRTSTDERIGGYLERIENWKEWFPDEPNFHFRNMTDGAAQVRIGSRVALENALEQEILTQFNRALDNLKTERGDASTQIKVMVVSSLAGGSGSGIMLLIPQLIKERVNKHANFSNINSIKGIFALPDIYLERINDPTQRKTIFSNAYAVFRELNAMNIIVNATDDEEVPEMVLGSFNSKDAHGNPAYQPYNLVFAMDKLNARDNIIPSFDTFMDHIAHSVYAQMFTPISNRIYSTEDNLFRMFTQNKMKSIYGSTGISRFIYPYKDLLKYCTFREIDNSISSRWHFFDNLYARALKNYEHQKRTDLNAVKPVQSKVIIDGIENELDENNQAFTFLRQDLLDTYEDGETINRVENYFDNLKVYLTDLPNNDEELARLQKQTRVQQSEGFETLADAEDTIAQTESKLETYKKKVDEFADRIIPIRVVDAILNEDMTDYTKNVGFETIIDHINDTNINTGIIDLSIFLQLLKKNNEYIHPLSARYVFMKLATLIRQELETVQTELDSEAEGILAYEEAFDDKTTPGIESPESIIGDFKGKHAVEWFTRHGKDFKQFVEDYVTKANRQLGRISNYAMLKVQKSVLEKLLKRIDSFVYAYNTFFEVLPQLRQELRNQATKLEGKNSSDTLTTYLYSTPTEMDSIFGIVNENYANKDGFDRLVTKELNEALYIEGLKDLNSKYAQTSLRDRKKSADRKRRERIKRVFKKVVIPTASKDIEEVSENILNRSVGAILVEEADRWADESLFELMIDSDMDDQETKDHIKTTWNNLRNKISSVYIKATPMVSYRSNSVQAKDFQDYKSNMQDRVFTNTIWGLNPESSEEIETVVHLEKQDNDLSTFMQFPGMVAKPEVLTSEDFSKYEMVCFTATYGLKAEELSSFNEYAKIYDQHIKRLNKNGVPGSITSESFREITPHLDIRWHNTLPRISSVAEAQERKAKGRALLLSLIYRSIELAEDENGIEFYEYYAPDLPFSSRITYQGKNITRDEIERLHKMILSDNNFIFELSKEPEQSFKKEIENIYYRSDPNKIFDSGFFRGLSGESGVHILNLMNEYWKGINLETLNEKQRNLELGYMTQFQNSLEDLIVEFAKEVDQSSYKDIVMKIKKELFETSDFFTLNPKSQEYRRFDRWSKQEVK